MSRRVVVTGMGAITPIGLSVDEFWAGVKEGKIGFAPITKFDASDFKCKLAAEVKGFDGKNYMDFKAAKRMEPFSQYAVAAAKEALEDAGIDMEKEDPYRVGVAVGSGTGSLQAMERSHSRLLEKGSSRIEPLFVPLTISNMAAGNVSIQFGLKGKSINVVSVTLFVSKLNSALLAADAVGSVWLPMEASKEAGRTEAGWPLAAIARAQSPATTQERKTLLMGFLRFCNLFDDPGRNTVAAAP